MEKTIGPMRIVSRIELRRPAVIVFSVSPSKVGGVNQFLNLYIALPFKFLARNEKIIRSGKVVLHINSIDYITPQQKGVYYQFSKVTKCKSSSICVWL